MKPYYDDGTCVIYHGDCREILPSLQATTCLTDPPYNVGTRYASNADRMHDADYHRWLRECLSLVEASNLVFFPGVVNVLTSAQVLGTDWEFRRLLGWHRKEFAGDKWIGGPAMSWEPIVWAARPGLARFNKRFGRGGRDFLVVDATHGDPFYALHPCPKPPSVMSWLIGLFCVPGSSVIDPFAGSGTTLWAAKQAGISAIGIEIEERYCEAAAKRLAQEVLPLGAMA